MEWVGTGRMADKAIASVAADFGVDELSYKFRGLALMHFSGESGATN